MQLNSIHLLLTYTCNFECDHCFLYCSPRSSGTFTLAQINALLTEVKNVPSIKSIGFEGGEPFLMYPLLLEAVKRCSAHGLATSIQTNNYWAVSPEDALLWLKPLYDAGLSGLDVSRDEFHHGTEPCETVENALSAAEAIGLATKQLSVKKTETASPEEIEKGHPIYRGGAKLRGRAADRLTNDLPVQPWESFTQCPFEDLESPGRVHLDAFGNLHLCQGLSMGNIWETPLSELLNAYDPHSHPICGPMLKGGPAELARTYNIRHQTGSADACHFCTRTCKALIDKFPQYLTPRQVYGLD